MTAESYPHLFGDLRALGASAPVRAAYEASKRSGFHSVLFGLPCRARSGESTAVRLGNLLPASAGAGHVVAIDASPLSAAGRIADHFELVPPIRDPSFVCAVQRVAHTYDVDVIVPTLDPELPVYATARTDFTRLGVDVWVSSPEVVELGRDKWRLHQWLCERGFDSPTTTRLREWGIHAARTQLIAKPRTGSASFGVLRVESREDLDRLGATDDYVLQDVAPGYEVTADFAVDAAGALLGIAARRRLEVRAGEVSKAVTIDSAVVTSTVEKLAAALDGAYGVLNVQMFVDDEAGAARIIEINPRFGGGYPLAWQAGVRFPEALVPGAQPQARIDGRPGVVMLRYDAAVFGSTDEMDVSR